MNDEILIPSIEERRSLLGVIEEEFFSREDAFICSSCGACACECVCICSQCGSCSVCACNCPD